MPVHDSLEVYAAVRAHVVSDGKVLLGRSTSRNGTWTTFGGKPQGEESVEETLRRELREELNVRTIAYKRLADRMETWDGKPARVAVFAVTAWDGEPENCAPHEHSEIRWFSSNDLESLTLSHAARAEALALISSGQSMEDE